jgi:tetratricopeptide (TPR) repeat protein
MLLGVDIDAKEKRIEAIKQEATKHLFKYQYDEAEKLLRTALKEYPNSYKLMEGLASVLNLKVSYHDTKWNEEKKKPMQEEIITLCEKILAECTDDSLRYQSIQLLCRIYVRIGETEKAASFAKKMPNQTQSGMITETLKGTEKYKHMQQQIASGAFFDVLNNIELLMDGSYAALDDGTAPYNSDEHIVLHHKIIDIVNILIEEGSFGDFTRQLASSHRRLASFYAKKDDGAASLNHFRLAAKHAGMYDSMPPISLINDDSREEYTSLLFKGVKFPFTASHPPYNMTERLLEISREFDSVLPAAELEEIRNELRKHTAIN